MNPLTYIICSKKENNDEARNYLQIGENVLAIEGVVTGNNNGNFLMNQHIFRGG